MNEAAGVPAASFLLDTVQRRERVALQAAAFSSHKTTEPPKPGVDV